MGSVSDAYHLALAGSFLSTRGCELLARRRSRSPVVYENESQTDPLPQIQLSQAP